jgi:magnesium and cobalt transporter
MTKKLHHTKKTSWFAHLAQRLKKRIGPTLDNKDELLTLLREAEQSSLLNTDTLLMMESVLEFSDMRVRDIMIPRTQMTTVSIDAEWEALVDIVHTSGHSRFPVMGEHRDEVIGILHAKNLLMYQLPDTPKFNLKDILKPVMFVPESKHLDILLKEFRRNRNHMAIVVDEYGGVCGFVTIEDLIEQIVGDIEDEFDIDEDAYIKKHSDKKYVLKAQMPIEEFNEYFGTNFEMSEYDTIGGMILKKIGHMPKKGEVIMINDYHFKVMSADTRRIKLLKLNIQAKPLES